MHLHTHACMPAASRVTAGRAAAGIAAGGSSGLALVRSRTHATAGMLAAGMRACVCRCMYMYMYTSVYMAVSILYP